MLERCPDCHAVIAGGREACQQLYDTFAFQVLEDVRIASVSSLAFDAYCMQHVETYGISAKSYAAHLTRLCAALEYPDPTGLYAILQRWYHGGLTKPPVLAERGSITLVDVMAQLTPEHKRDKVREWAENVWMAYASQHAIARAWVEEALRTSRKH